MANWAKHIEDTVGLEVAKRAKHGIHFKTGNPNEFRADFSGKPCHFQENGLWKPIDTKLLLTPDGFYGCPHSPVRIHKDGHVKVEGTDYQQYTELPSATGLVDNDRIVRTFSFGEQRMWVTEDGFRSEIQLNRIPTLKEARKLIASESGTLSKAYLKSLTTATDANGDVHTVTTLSAFRTWLASAVFPVVIDPDFSIGDTLYGDTTLDSTNPTKNRGAVVILTATGSGYCVLMRFDLTSISGDATCTDAMLHLFKYSTSSATARTATLYSIASGNTDWVAGTKSGALAGSGEPCWNARKADGSGGVTEAWAGSAGCATSGTDYEATAIGTFNFDRSDPDKTEYTPSLTVARVEGWFGVTNTNYGIRLVTTGSGGSFYSSEVADTSIDPYLTVTYTAAGTFIPINMSAQMQNLSGNMRG